jgi:hypothetical protein
MREEPVFIHIRLYQVDNDTMKKKDSQTEVVVS